MARRGLRTIVLEEQVQPYPLPRAVHLDHEMMRLFESAGVLEAVEPLMLATDGHIHIGADGGVIRYLGTAGRPKPFSFSNDYFFYQPELEEALRKSLDRFEHVEVQLGATVTGLRETAEAVELTVAQGRDIKTVCARYVIGCDGARSTIRKALHVPLDDLRFEEPWLVVDAEVDGPISFPDFEGIPPEAELQRLSVMLCDPRRPATIVPGRGNHRRWEFMLLPGESDEEMMAPARVAELVGPWVQGVPHRIVRAATYRFHGLVAERWQVGRVFLAGDAAHQTPPFFGQGMCHGFRDVANLAWKLELVLGGAAGAELLETYQPERDPHVRSVIGASVEAGRYICELNPKVAAERDRRLREAMRSGPPRTAADLIPPIGEGVVAKQGSAEAGIGVRFIQPRVAAAGRAPLRLDEVTGGGWVLLSVHSNAKHLPEQAQEDWSSLGGKTFVVGEDLADSEGHLSTWFRQHGASAVVVRPDFYTYGTAAEPDGIAELIKKLAFDLSLIRQPAGVLV
jgi:3-(3-hydroxy-phenyl)propionate hydroxylase